MAFHLIRSQFDDNLNKNILSEIDCIDFTIYNGRIRFNQPPRHIGRIHTIYTWGTVATIYCDSNFDLWDLDADVAMTTNTIRCVDGSRAWNGYIYRDWTKRVQCRISNSEHFFNIFKSLPSKT